MVWAVLLGALALGSACNGNLSGSARDGASSDATRRDGTVDGTLDGARDGGAPDAAPGTSCAAGCHGGAGSAAPPLSLKGQSSTGERGVGAHQRHLASSTWHAPIACTACHRVPAQVSDEGHIDTPLPAELTFSPLASTDGASPSWNGTTCGGTYCHGATLSGGTATTPTWTQVDGAQVQCGSCHGMPPTENHTTSTSCSACHVGVVDSANQIVQPALHIDGKVTAGSGGHPSGYGQGSVHGPDFLKNPSSCTACHGTSLGGGTGTSCESCHSGWKTSCTFCHGGNQNSTGAPPVSVSKETGTSVPAVGRHTSHVTEGGSHLAYGCSLCHAVPADALSPGHIDPSPGEVAFSGLAAGTSYDHGTHQCTNVYCHGSGRAGATGSASWVGNLSGCASCHSDETKGSSMTLSGEHEKHILEEGMGCSSCHGCVVNGSKQIVDKSRHINKQRDVCLPSWNASARTCSPAGCHGTETW